MSCIKILQTSIGTQLSFKVCVLNWEVTRCLQEMILSTDKPNLIWGLLHLRTRTLTLPSVCHPQGHNLPICVQWYKLSTRSLLQWTITYKYRQADQKGTLSPQPSLIFKYFSYLIYIRYIECFIVFTCIHKCLCNGIHDAESCMHTCICLHITWTITTPGLW